MINAIGFYLFYGFAWVLALLPFRFLYGISDVLYGIVFYVVGYRKKVVFMNLRNAFPEKNEEELSTIAKGFYQHLTDVMIEIIKMIHMSPRELNKRFTYEGMEHFKHAWNNNRHVFAFIGHYGNWEWLSGLGNHLSHTAFTVYKPLHNKYFDQFIYRLRSKFGVDLLPIHKTSRTLISYYKKEALTATGFIADQSPVWEDIGYWNQFMNQDTPWYLGVEKLARMMNADVVFLKVEKVKRGYYRTKVLELFKESSQLEPYTITEKYANVLEETIKETPEYWLWSHRRWKRQRNQTN